MASANKNSKRYYIYIILFIFIHFFILSSVRGKVRGKLLTVVALLVVFLQPLLRLVPMADAAGGGSPFDVHAPAPAAAPAPEPEQPGDFVFIGVKPRALTRLLDIYPEIVGKKLTTSDVCHTILKPMTTPDGWVDRATCTNPQESWYEHEYHREGQTVQAPWEESDRADTRCAANTLNTNRLRSDTHHRSGPVTPAGPC